ncbi:MAG TPA: hypothetical protein VIY51_20740 [Xanthobacteraceae bacterium]
MTVAAAMDDDTEIAVDTAPEEVELIEWLDHCGISGGVWSKAVVAAQLRPAVNHSAGWIVEEGERYLIIAGSRADNEKFGKLTLILKGCIVTRKKLA